MIDQEPYEILDLEPGASEEQIRAAYLKKIQQYSPDRSPEEFERVRDAYDELRDPRGRTRRMLFSGDPLPPLTHLLDGKLPARRFVSAKLWLAVLRER